MVLPPDNAMIHFLPKPSYPLFLSLVEHTVVELPNRFGKSFQGESGLVQTYRGNGFCTSQVERLIALIMCPLLGVGTAQHWCLVGN